MFTRVITTGLLLTLTLSSGEEPCHFTVKMDVQGAGARKTVRTSAPSRPGNESPRPLLEVTAGDEITIAWTVTALEKNPGSLKDITIHSFLAREEEIGQTRRPPLDEAAVLETALLMDFSAEDSAKGTFEVVVDEPGSYVVEVETMGLAAMEDHEHAATLDVKVVPATAKEREATGKKETKQ